MEAGEGRGEAFVVAAEAAEAGEPGKGAFDDPAAWEQDEAAFGLRQSDHEKVEAGLRGLGGGFAAGVALIDIGHADLLLGGRLDLRGEGANLGAFLRIGGVTFKASNCPSVSTAMWTLEPLRRLWPS